MFLIDHMPLVTLKVYVDDDDDVSISWEMLSKKQLNLVFF